MTGELAGRAAMVTGGASGIGRAATLALARAGAAVAFTYMTSADEAREVAAEIVGGGGRALAIQADMTKAAAVADAFAQAEAAHGALEILFANAGGLIKRERCVDQTPEFWDQAFALNVTSTFLACRAALRGMEARGRGAVVTMASLAAFDGGGPGASHYAASKGAIVTYTRALAKEVGPLGIRVNGVAPGLIATRFHEQFNTPEGRRGTVERTPVRREGTSEDVADAVVYLASDRASFLAGEIIQINGGLGIF